MHLKYVNFFVLDLIILLHILVIKHINFIDKCINFIEKCINLELGRMETIYIFKIKKNNNNKKKQSFEILT